MSRYDCLEFLRHTPVETYSVYYTLSTMLKYGVVFLAENSNGTGVLFKGFSSIWGGRLLCASFGLLKSAFRECYERFRKSPWNENELH